MTFIAAVVEASRRRARAVIAGLVILAVAAAIYVARHISIDSDTSKLVDPNLPWQKAAADLDRQFPQNDDLLVAVVDGASAQQSTAAAATLAAALRGQPERFEYVRQPDENPYFRRYGILLLPTAQVQDFSDHLIAAQPFLGTLAADPSVRGVLEAMDLLAQGALQGQATAAQIDPTLRALTASAAAAAAGRAEPLSWQELFSGMKAGPGDRRHFVLARARLNYGQVTAGEAPIQAIHAAAVSHGLTPEHGVSVRVTGPVALNNDQLAALSESAVSSTVLCLGLLLVWLVAGLRSLRIVLAVLITLIVGLIACAAFAVRFIGPFNPVSIAFAPLFVGIAIDFGIQFSIRYSAERLKAPTPDALRQTALGVGPPLSVAAAATAAGFLAFAPTHYLGVNDLGLIAGAGMIIALVLNLTLLPALITVLNVPGRPEAEGFAWGGPADRALVRRRRAVLTVVGLAALAAVLVLPRLSFDFNPVDLENPHTESVQTLRDLMNDPGTSPYSIQFLAPPSQAQAAADQLNRLPEVARVLDLGVFVPTDQDAKLAILQDAASLLGPTLSPPKVKPPPGPEDVLASARRCADDLAKVGARGDRPAADLAAALRAVVARGAGAVPLLAANLSAGIAQQLDDLRTILSAGPVSLATMPAEFRRDWEAPDGRWLVEVFPSGNTQRNAVLERFGQAVRRIVPQAVGSAITVDEFTKMAPRTFGIAGALALVVISLLLWAVLRSLRDVLLVLVPLLIAGLLTLATAALFGLSINFANIITLPMMLGIGVAFDIYFVMRRRGHDRGLLRSPTARGVVFSAFTTGSAFGSLALSQSPGMAGMGKFLSVALAFILLCTLIILPALGRPESEAARP